MKACQTDRKDKKMETEKQIKVVVRCYDDRGDPCPPNNYRPEIIIDGDRYYSGDKGCMPREKAIEIAKKLAKILDVEFSPEKV
jgi:hypothetical protein